MKYNLVNETFMDNSTLTLVNKTVVDNSTGIVSWMLVNKTVEEEIPIEKCEQRFKFV